MINLKDARLTDCLPEVVAKTPEAASLSFAFEKMKERLLGYADKVNLYTNIDALPSEMLDALALELNIPRYSVKYTDAQKKALIKGLILYREKAGTVSAVVDLCTAIFGDAIVTEWFDYGADPGYYKVSTTNPNISDADIDLVKNTARSVARESQWLDLVELMLTCSANIYNGMVVRCGTTETLNCNCKI